MHMLELVTWFLRVIVALNLRLDIKVDRQRDFVSFGEISL